MKVTHHYSSNYFPYVNIELQSFGSGAYLFYTYQAPNDRRYQKSVKGVWRVRYKKIDFAYCCKGQNLKQMPEGAIYESTILCK